MTFFKVYFLALTLLMFLRVESSNDTNLLLRKSVGFGYYLTDGFLYLIRGRDGENVRNEAKNFILMINNKTNPTFETFSPFIKTSVTSYVGYAVCLIFGILFVILMPIIGLIILCCRCCNRCGAKPQLTYKKHDKKNIAIIVAFINHHLTNEAVTETNSPSFFDEMKNGFDQLEKSVDSLVNKAESTTNVDLSPQKKEFFNTVDELLNDYKKNLMSSKDIVNYTRYTKDFMEVTNQFRGDSSKSAETRTYSERLNVVDQEIDTLRNEIVETINTKCSNPDRISECNRLRQLTLDNLKFNLDNSKLLNDKVSLYFDTLIQQDMNLEKLNKIDEIWKNIDVKSKINDKLEESWKELSENKEKRQALAAMFKKFGSIGNRTINHSRQILSDVFKPVQTIERYRFYIMFAVLALVVWIIFLIYLGLCFGTCGSRPYTDSGACNKGVGANLLLAALGFIFIFSSIMMIVCLVFFLQGGLMQSEICHSFEDDGRNETSFLDIYYSLAVNESIVFKEDLEEYRSDMAHLKPVDAIWKKCKNDSFVNSLGGPNFRLPVDNEIQKELEEVMKELKNVKIEEPVDEKIQELIQSYGTISPLKDVFFTLLLEEINKPIINEAINLKNYISELEALQISDLGPSIAKLKTDILPLEENKDTFKLNIISVEKSLDLLRVGDKNLQELKGGIREIVRPLFDKGLTSLKPKFFGQLRMAVLAMWQPIKCDELQSAAKRTSDGYCKKLLQPFNGIWSGLGLCLLLYIPMICLIIGLVSIYRKTEDYLSEFEEPDYDDFDNFISFKGFYISPNNDQINNTKESKKKKSKNDARKKGYEQIAVYPYDAYE